MRQIYKMVSCKDLTGTVICREYDLDNQAWIDEQTEKPAIFTMAGFCDFITEGSEKMGYHTDRK